MVVHLVAGHQVAADERGHLVGCGLPVAAGGAQEDDPFRRHPEPCQLVEERGQHGAVRHRASEVGEDDGDPAGRVDELRERRARVRGPERPGDRVAFVLEPGEIGGQDHVRVVGNRCHQAAGPVREGHVHPVLHSLRSSPSTPSATRSTSGRRSR